ncbi:ABC transporter ATP-binding protein [Brevibacillus dissolubilis]|uniref:ABC transporter ATP-binding protein n=1 Tax=Brevibacillus dissolubilis TaxID=1844116 RepID=UPI001115DDBB|nr:ABC transporter ATP-binding protein [Brevibacillus dissolubilis]
MNQPSVIRRLIAYAQPFRKSIFFALFLLILGTSAELSGPFIAKLAIDNHILSIQKKWYTVESFSAQMTENVQKVNIGTQELIREDWFSEEYADEVSRQKPLQILSEDTKYYLIQGTFGLEGQRTITDTGRSEGGRGVYMISVGQGDRQEQLEAVLLTAEEVESLYTSEIPPLLGLVGLYAGLIVVSAGLNYVQLLSLNTTAQRIIQKMRIDLFTHLQKLPVSYFDRTPVGSLVSRATNDTEAIRELYVSVLATFVQNGVYMIGILAALLLMHPTMAMVCLMAVPFILVLVGVYRYYSSRTFAIIRSRLSDLNATINEMIQNMAVVQAFRREQAVEAEFARVNQEYYQGRIRENNFQALLLRPAVDVLEKLVVTGIVWYFGQTALDDMAAGTPVTFGILFAFVDYLGRFFEPINIVLSRLPQLQQALTASGRVFEVLDTPTMQEPKHNTLPRPTGEVVFENVWFAYKDDEYVLKDISFTAKPGQTIALVGHTGSGKSSLMNVLLRFYEIAKGRITIDGVDIAELDPKSLRQHIGLVLQDPFLFTGDVAFNIKLYDEGKISDEAMRDAAVAVKADPFVQQLPDGYAEQVVERGATLSAGQRQLLSFARALAADPAILILDEATANIDSETESAIQDALHVLSSGRTTFIIAHRLSTIQHADQILVLSRGEIVEQGTHEQLMSQDGVYQKMYELQQGGRTAGQALDTSAMSQV